ncbi:hypothetical protein SBV1_510010 [Verrucomicrobia bacterium]|nr:hypothetical protein SBV1_510010 [Verrucomicrobiota bacterium]
MILMVPRLETKDADVLICCFHDSFLTLWLRVCDAVRFPAFKGHGAKREQMSPTNVSVISLIPVLSLLDGDRQRSLTGGPSMLLPIFSAMRKPPET